MTLYRVIINRVADSAAKFMVEHPDLSVSECIEMAFIEEAFLYGVPGEKQPVGILGKSVFQSIKK